MVFKKLKYFCHSTLNIWPRQNWKMKIELFGVLICYVMPVWAINNGFNATPQKIRNQCRSRCWGARVKRNEVINRLGAHIQVWSVAPLFISLPFQLLTNLDFSWQNCCKKIVLIYPIIFYLFILCKKMRILLNTYCCSIKT